MGGVLGRQKAHAGEPVVTADLSLESEVREAAAVAQGAGDGASHQSQSASNLRQLYVRASSSPPVLPLSFSRSRCEARDR